MLICIVTKQDHQDMLPDHQIAKADLADLIEATAPGGAGKLRRLRDLTSSSYGALRMTLDRQNELREAAQAAEARLRHLRRPPSGVAARDDDTSVRDAQRSADSTAAELKRLAPIHDAQAAIWTARAGLVRDVEDWMRGILSSGAKVVDIPAAAPTLKKGSTLLDLIEAHRRRARTLAADRHTAESAPIPSTVAKQRMRAQISALAESGRPDVTQLVEHGLQVQFATEERQALARGEAAAHVGWQQADALALVAWVNRDVLIKKLEVEIDAEAGDEHALTDHERAAQVEAANRDIAATEADESALVWLALDQRLTVEHRPDVSPAALLGIRVVEAVERPAPQSERAGWTKRW